MAATGRPTRPLSPSGGLQRRSGPMLMHPQPIRPMGMVPWPARTMPSAPGDPRRRSWMVPTPPGLPSPPTQLPPPARHSPGQFQPRPFPRPPSPQPRAPFPTINRPPSAGGAYSMPAPPVGLAHLRRSRSDPTRPPRPLSPGPSLNTRMGSTGGVRPSSPRPQPAGLPPLVGPPTPRPPVGLADLRRSRSDPSRPRMPISPGSSPSAQLSRGRPVSPRPPPTALPQPAPIPRRAPFPPPRQAPTPRVLPAPLPSRSNFSSAPPVANRNPSPPPPPYRRATSPPPRMPPSPPPPSHPLVPRRDSSPLRRTPPIVRLVTPPPVRRSPSPALRTPSPRRPESRPHAVTRTLPAVIGGQVKFSDDVGAGTGLTKKPDGGIRLVVSNELGNLYESLAAAIKAYIDMQECMLRDCELPDLSSFGGDMLKHVQMLMRLFVLLISYIQRCKPVFEHGAGIATALLRIHTSDRVSLMNIAKQQVVWLETCSTLRSHAETMRKEVKSVADYFKAVVDRNDPYAPVGVPEVHRRFRMSADIYATLIPLAWQEEVKKQFSLALKRRSGVSTAADHARFLQLRASRFEEYHKVDAHRLAQRTIELAARFLSEQARFGAISGERYAHFHRALDSTIPPNLTKPQPNPAYLHFASRGRRPSPDRTYPRGILKTTPSPPRLRSGWAR